MKARVSLMLLLFSLSAVASTRVVVFGDSLSAGYGIDKAKAFPACLQELAQANGLDVEILNAGVSGDTSAGGLRRIDWSLRQNLDILILELGANDGLRGISTEETASNLQSIIDRVKKKNPAAKIIIAGMTLPPNLGADYIHRFEAIFKDLARTNTAILIPFLLEGVAGRPELNQADGIHPTEEGHRKVASHVLPYLVQAMKMGKAQR